MKQSKIVLIMIKGERIFMNFRVTFFLLSSSLSDLCDSISLWTYFWGKIIHKQFRK